MRRLGGWQTDAPEGGCCANAALYIDQGPTARDARWLPMTLDVRSWLQARGFERYADVFEANEIDGEALPALTEHHLKELGIAIGPRAKLLRAIAELAADAGQATAAAAPAVAPAAAEAERRQLTVMFVDLVGSTALSGRLDPEDLRAVIRAYQKVVAAEVGRFEGHIAQYLGDGVLAYFGFPIAHEDEAERAVRAALAVLAAVGAMQARGGEALAARIGIATGLAVVGDLVGEGATKEHAVVGETPNLAARLQGLAAPGQLVVSARTRELIGHVFELQNLGPQNLKGIAVPVVAYAVTGERPAESRFEAYASGRMGPMVGREGELAMLMQRWRMAAAGEGQLVVLVGDAGIGKSRIVRALQDALATEPHLRIGYQCSPHHADTAMFPVAQQLKRATGIGAADADAAKLDRLEALLGGTAATAAQDIALLAALLGIDASARYGPLQFTPQQQRQRTFDALIQQTLFLSRNRPLLIVLEDAHWIDPSTLELVELSAERIAASGVLMLITARPTFTHDFGKRSDVSRIVLNRLGRTQIEAVVNRVAGGKPLPEVLIREIAAKTDGVPLYAEELTKTLLESGALQESEDGYVLNRAQQTVAVPASLHDSLMARLDRLQPVKDVAQAAACIGREFSHALLAAILPLGADALRDALRRLAQAELIFHQGVEPNARYVFKHALVRDAAYESLLRSRRQEIHARLVKALEAAPDSAPELLAHHATQAGLAEQAIAYWQKAAARAAARPAYQEAISHLTQAIALCEQMGDGRAWIEKRVLLLLTLGQTSIPLRGYGHAQTVAAFTRAEELAGTISDAPHRFAIMHAVWVAQYIHGAQDKALAIAHEMVAWAQRDDNRGHKITALRSLAISQMIAGEPLRARDSFAAAMELSNAQPRSAEQRLALAQRFAAEPEIASRFHMALTAWSLGQVGEARRMAAAALAEARSLRHVHTLGHALAHATILAVVGREAAQALALGAETIEFAQKHELEMWKGYGALLRAFALALSGDPAASVPLMETGFRYMARTQTGTMVPLHHAVHARSLASLGRFEDAARHLQIVRAELQGGSERYFWPECHRLIGDALSLFPDRRAADVEAAYAQALALSRGQQAKSWELYAALSLARHWAEQGEQAKARALLAPVHVGFGDGAQLQAFGEVERLTAELG
jgi:class 3 adenylate cyclase